MNWFKLLKHIYNTSKIDIRYQLQNFCPPKKGFRSKALQSEPLEALESKNGLTAITVMKFPGIIKYRV
jgi:hypothetical protein